MKKMQKMLSIILSAILAVSLCCTAPMTAAAKEDNVSQALAAATQGAENFGPAEIVNSMYKIITITLTIDGLDIAQADLDAINQALETAKPVIDNPNATELELQGAAMVLSGAMAVLSPYMEAIGDEISPQMILVVCESLRMTLYTGMAGELTQDQVTAIENALKAAESVANDPASSKEDLQAAFDELMEAIEAIGPDVPFDQEEAREEILFEAENLEDQVGTIAFLLSEKDVTAILDIVEEMTAIAEQDEITQADYDYAQELYGSAFDYLNKYYTRENLKRVIDYAQETLASGEYHPMSVEILQDLINDAQLLYNDDTASDLEIMVAIQNILISINYLEPIEPEDPTEDPTEAPTDEPTSEPTAAPTDKPATAPTNAPTKAPTSAPTKPGDGNGKVNTGDNSGTAVATLTIVMLAAAAFVVISRKKKETV